MDKNRGMIVDTADEIIELCSQAVEQNNEENGANGAGRVHAPIQRHLPVRM